MPGTIRQNWPHLTNPAALLMVGLLLWQRVDALSAKVAQLERTVDRLEMRLSDPKSENPDRLTSYGSRTAARPETTTGGVRP